MASDAELVAGISQGDLGAFEALYERYKGPIYRTAFAITHDHGAAEELLQDCFLRAYDHIDQANGDPSLAPWLHRIAMNLALSRMRRKRFSLCPIDDLAQYLFDGERSPEEVAEGKEVQRAVHAALCKLSLDHRAVAVLYYVQGFSLADVAYALDCPLGTVKSRLHYATKALRGQLRSEVEAPNAAALPPEARMGRGHNASPARTVPASWSAITVGEG